MTKEDALKQQNLPLEDVPLRYLVTEKPLVPSSLQGQSFVPCAFDPVPDISSRPGCTLAASNGFGCGSRFFAVAQRGLCFLLGLCWCSGPCATVLFRPLLLLGLCIFDEASSTPRAARSSLKIEKLSGRIVGGTLISDAVNLEIWFHVSLLFIHAWEYASRLHLPFQFLISHIYGCRTTWIYG